MLSMTFWAGDILTRGSTTGYDCSKRTSGLAIDTPDHDGHQAMYVGTQEIVWIRGVLAVLNLWLNKPMPCILHSQSAEDLA